MSLQVYVSMSGLFLGTLAALLGFIVWHQGKKTKAEKLIVAFMLSAVAWIIPYSIFPFAPTEKSALFWFQALSIGPLYISLFNLHFHLVWLEIEQKYKRVIYLEYAIAVILTLFVFHQSFISGVEPRFSFKYWAIPGPLWYFYNAIFIANFIAIFVLLVKYYKHTSGRKRHQAKLLFVASFLGFVGGIFNFPIWYNINILPLGNPISALYVVVFGYAIVTQRLINIKFVLRQSVVFFLSLFTITIYVALLKYLGVVFFGKDADWIDYFLVVFTIVTFPTIKNKSSALANRYFFSSLYDAKQLIGEISEKIRTTLDEDKVSEIMFKSLRDAFHMKTFAVFGFDVKNNRYPLLFKKGKFPRESLSLRSYPKLQRKFIKKNNAIVIEDLSEEDARSFAKFVSKAHRYGIELFVPVNIKKKNIGLLALGAKESREPYSEDDIEVLRIIASLAGTAIENARLYLEVKEQNKNLTELLSMKGDFLRVVNHQLNTPVSIMKMGLSSVEDKTISVERGLKVASDGLDRISKTLTTFWDAYELEGEHVEINCERTDVLELIAGIVSERKNLEIVQKRKLKIVIQKPRHSAREYPFENGFIPDVSCDQKRIVHVISNIIDNAIHYTEKGGIKVFFGYKKKQKKEFLKVFVADTGMGISKKDASKVFEKFSRGGRAHLAHQNGSGLGLYIAQKIIFEHGGEIKLEKSTVDKGSTFSFTLPIFKEQEKNGFGTRKSGCNKKSKKKKNISAIDLRHSDDNTMKKKVKTSLLEKRASKILVVDDEKEMLELFGKYFEKNGIKYFSARTTIRGFAIAKKEKPKVIFVDTIIPSKRDDGKIDFLAEQGIELLKMLKNETKTKKIPVFMLSDLNNKKIRKKAEKFGSAGYIFKGDIKPHDLLKIVKKYL